MFDLFFRKHKIIKHEDQNRYFSSMAERVQFEMKLKDLAKVKLKQSKHIPSFTKEEISQLSHDEYKLYMKYKKGA